MGISRSINPAAYKPSDPCKLLVGSDWESSRALIWSRPAALEAPNQLRDYVETTGIQVGLAQVIDDVNPPPSAAWWTVTCYPKETTSEQVGPALVPPLNASVVNAGNPSTEVQLVVRAHGETIFVDIGKGVQFSLLAGNISIAPWVPGPWVQGSAIRSPGLNPTSGLDLLALGEEETVPVFNTMLGMRFTAAMSSSRSRQPVTCTRTYTPADPDIPVAEGTAIPSPGDFQIPPRAKRVQFAVRFADEPPPTDVGVNFLSDVVSRFSRGAVTQWSVGARERTSPWVDIPQNAQLINIASLTGRIVTAVWELDL